jgi:di/tricarboxylate transporter
MDFGMGRMLNIFLAYISGIVITPALLPYLPFRRFAFKGFVSGILVAAILLLSHNTGNNIYENISWFLIIPAVSSFMAMNFTGSSTYTSLSGVKKEAWQLLAIFVATIVGLILTPLPMGAVVIIGVMMTTLTGILKIGTAWPLPSKLLAKHMANAKRILFVEEVDPFLENNVKELAAEWSPEIGSWNFYGYLFLNRTDLFNTRFHETSFR